MKDIEQNEILKSSGKISAKLPNLLVAAERVAISVMQGVHGRKKTGQGESFWQFREYDSSDSIRDIDWRKSAKSDKIFIKQKEWEASQSIYLWRDSSKSMDYSFGKKIDKKLYIADLILTSLSILLINGGEQVSLLGSDGKKFRTKTAIPELVEYNINNQFPMIENKPLPSNSNIILIGDFLGDISELDKFLSSLQQRQINIMLIQILDRSEIDLPFLGNVDFHGLEMEEMVKIPDVNAIKEQYKAKINAHNQKLEQLAKKKSVSFIRHMSDENLEKSMQEIYQRLSKNINGGA